MYTTRETIPIIGQQVEVRFESLTITCTVRDVKQAYGQVRLLVIPAAGSGQQWITIGRVGRITTRTPQYLPTTDFIDHGDAEKEA